jgi:hypothetical protein
MGAILSSHLYRYVRCPQDEVEGEDDMTLAELKHRPCGKASMARSSLHDDITVIIIDVIGTDDIAAETQREQWYVTDVARRNDKAKQVCGQSTGSPESLLTQMPRQQSGDAAARSPEAGVVKGVTATGPPAVPAEVAAAALTAGATGAVFAGAGGGNTLSGPPVLGGELAGASAGSGGGRTSSEQPMAIRPLQIVSSPSLDSVASCDSAAICAAEGTDAFHSSPRAAFTRGIAEDQEPLHDFNGGMSRSGSSGGFGGRSGRQRKAKGMSRIRSHQLMDLAAMAALAAEATEQHEALYAETQRKSPLTLPMGGPAAAGPPIAMLT